MRLIRKNVERIADSEIQIDKLKKEGFSELDRERAQKGSAEASEEDPEKDITDMKSMTAAELRTLAKEHEIGGVDSLNKAELIAVLKGVV